MAPVEILVKLMSAFMYRRAVGLVSLLTVQPGRAAAATMRAQPGYTQHQHIAKCRCNPQREFLTGKGEEKEAPQNP